jgi:hypothetical protein
LDLASTEPTAIALAMGTVGNSGISSCRAINTFRKRACTLVAAYFIVFALCILLFYRA